jgi:hypothetical protein
MSSHGRSHFVRLQLELARKALMRDDLQGARSVLRALGPHDFDGAIVVSAICLRVLRDDSASETDLRAAANVLVRLPVHREEVKTS